MDYLTFKNHTDFFRVTLSDELAVNLSEYINYALLSIGAFNNVSINSSGAYGGSESYLRLVDDPNYSNNQIYEGFRSNWVYESGITYSFYNPITISGIYINGTFYNNAFSGSKSYIINYPLGRVVFDHPPVTGIIRAEYSYKYVNVSTSDVPWFRQIQANSFRIDSQQYLQKSSGDWSMLGQSRVQLPAIVIDPTTRIHLEPVQLGDGNLKRLQDVICYVIAESPWDRNKLVDILLDQKDKTIFLFNVDKVNESGLFPINSWDGSLNSNGYQYNQLVGESEGFRSRRCVFRETVSQDMRNLPALYFGGVRITCEIYPGTY